MAEHDLQVRQRLVEAGTLSDDYHAEMEAVHRQNAARLAEILSARGWPDASIVGEDGNDAAWLILQHAIPCPDLQRQGLALLRSAAAEGRASKIHVALLEDRIAVFEGREQTYGTQFDWDEHSQLSPDPIAAPESVDERRAAIGLPPLGETIAKMRADAAAAGARPPADPVGKLERKQAWLREVGWRR